MVLTTEERATLIQCARDSERIAERIDRIREAVFTRAYKEDDNGVTTGYLMTLKFISTMYSLLGSTSCVVYESERGDISEQAVNGVLKKWGMEELQ